MVKLTVGIDTMMCGMCEAHIQDTIRSNFNVKKVKASHTKGVAEIIAPEDISDEELHAAIDDTGYTVTSVKREPYKKKFGLF